MAARIVGWKAEIEESVDQDHHDGAFLLSAGAPLSFSGLYNVLLGDTWRMMVLMTGSTHWPGAWGLRSSWVGAAGAELLEERGRELLCCPPLLLAALPSSSASLEKSFRPLRNVQYCKCSPGWHLGHSHVCMGLAKVCVTDCDDLHSFCFGKHSILYWHRIKTRCLKEY